MVYIPVQTNEYLMYRFDVRCRAMATREKERDTQKEISINRDTHYYLIRSSCTMENRRETPEDLSLLARGDYTLPSTTCALCAHLQSLLQKRIFTMLCIYVYTCVHPTLFSTYIDDACTTGRTS